uniref:Uncharacterized protein n=1 Tax=Hemiselmis tepida TaxID=464990 RepID=A0A7S0Z5E1_9CRYP|mmetsp:Transcript_37992/g.97098  ORF Transcript_37992/g.97098 Transcript_37992/m.97098 type:complete len:261 (+) Transcript_37992:38-820(+)|eukprot:CAMPEP_0174921502 /NCGR_PEP_ID=MMETSP1355-20121228/5191_1 /TAXON_ID=464990 /ORGANISM="Hemiselmis tepida, Strain CCMP443" /LENGTH=260 /DNA_ID=CAMNT_0016166985 /DNA_START=33 /DNA_END=815 /DNA_ORIENTATION=-
MAVTSRLVIQAFGLLCMLAGVAGFAGHHLPNGALPSSRGAAPPMSVCMAVQRGTGEAKDRAAFLRLATGAALGLAAGLPVAARPGDYAKQDYSGTGGNSQSSLGANDVPAAGKIDPYDDRVKAQAKFGEKMQSAESLSEYKDMAFEAKEKIFAQLSKDIEKKDWKAASAFLNRELFVLRRAMYPVSTKGLRAVSAAVKGGEPDKPATKSELAEKTFLGTMNKLAVALNGEKAGGTDWVRAGKAFSKAEEDWQKWVRLIEE